MNTCRQMYGTSHKRQELNPISPAIAFIIGSSSILVPSPRIHQVDSPENKETEGREGVDSAEDRRRHGGAAFQDLHSWAAF